MPIRVVVAEDHALVREGIRRILDMHPDIEVVGEASDGNEAVDLVLSLHPDVVLMDIAMPRLNGIEATRCIRTAQPRTAVLVLTAYDDEAFVLALTDAGAAGYLLKNAPSQQLLSAVRAVHAGESVLSLPIALKLIERRAGTDVGKAEPSDECSGRELEILRLAARGLANRAIADAMSLTPREVQVDLHRVFGKLNVGSRTQAVVEALRRSLIRFEEIEH